MFIPDVDMRHKTISQQLNAGLAAIDKGQAVMEFSQTRHIDSSAVACILAWKRHAQQRGVALKFEKMPGSLTQLMELYGVADLVE